MDTSEPILGQRFEDALLYAAKLHAKQIRKGVGIPYISHLIGVASIALEHGADEDEAIPQAIVGFWRKGKTWRP